MTITTVNDDLLWNDAGGVRQSSLVVKSVPAGYVNGSGVYVADPLGSATNPLTISSSAASSSASAGIYKRAAAVSATAGDGVFVSGVTTLGTVTLTLANGGTITATVPLGSTLLPFSVTAAALGTAIGGTFQSVFFV